MDRKLNATKHKSALNSEFKIDKVHDKKNIKGVLTNIFLEHLNANKSQIQKRTGTKKSGLKC